MNLLRFRNLLCLSVMLTGPSLPAAASGLRDTVNFNRGWKFQLGDLPGAEAAAFDDAKWDGANLPHSFSMPYFAADRFHVGYGWYRKHFDVPKAWAGQRINLEFDGVFQVAEVFVNGRRVGEHKGGYTGFNFEITDVAKTGDNPVDEYTSPLGFRWFKFTAGQGFFLDGETNWKLLVDQTRTASNSADRTDLVPGNSIPGRFVRVSVVGSPLERSPALAELEVFGTQAAP